MCPVKMPIKSNVENATFDVFHMIHSNNFMDNHSYKTFSTLLKVAVLKELALPLGISSITSLSILS